MHISLIATVHAESGCANVKELLTILEHLQPKVIFAEIPMSHFADYLDGSHGNLESAAVVRYRKRYPVEVVPVDLDKPNEEFFRNLKDMYRQIEKTSPKYRHLIDKNCDDIQAYGFPYLNSECCSQALAAINDEAYATVEWTGNAKLRQTYSLWRETNDCREMAMLENINSYYSRCGPSPGVLLLGAGHRKAMMEKVQKQQDTSTVGCSWNFESLVDYRQC